MVVYDVLSLFIYHYQFVVREREKVSEIERESVSEIERDRQADRERERDCCSFLFVFYSI